MKRVTNACLLNKFVTSNTGGNSGTCLGMRWDEIQRAVGFGRSSLLGTAGVGILAPTLSLCRDISMDWTLRFCLLY